VDNFKKANLLTTSDDLSKTFKWKPPLASLVKINFNGALDVNVIKVAGTLIGIKLAIYMGFLEFQLERGIDVDHKVYSVSHLLSDFLLTFCLLNM